MPTQKGSNADPYVTGIALPNVPLGNYVVPSGWPTSVKFNPPGDVPGPPVQFESEGMGDPGAGYGFESDHTYEADWFFFHTDHLGSTSYLTDTAGNVSQFVCYTPYGEAIVDEHLTTYENPFKFSGKELDDITGLYDHGARNRNPITAVWYGIDELFEKYPENGPYGYCGGNPVRFVDLDGRKITKYTKVVDDGVYSTKIGFINEKRWEAFAKTPSGYQILSLFAKSGEKIGSVEFKKDGIYSRHELELYDYDIAYSDCGFNSPFDIKSDRLVFKIAINHNSLSIKSDENAEVTIGHEFFIHFDKYYKIAIEAFNKNDIKFLKKIIDGVNWKKRGENDHSDIKFQNKRVFKFNQYVEQLKRQAKYPQKVIKAKKEHDAKYK